MPEFGLDASPRVTGASTGIKHDEGVALEERNRDLIDRVLNPNPVAYDRWLRRMVVRDVRRRGKLSKQEIIMRTERESTSKSHWFKTSLKKLRPLATQIAGKNIDDAILQMRFSKKKVAKDLKEFLEQAKHQAILARGMGAGQVAPTLKKENKSALLDPEDPDFPPALKIKPVEVRLKDGRTLQVADKTSIYIEQAWVNRGPYGRELDYRGRGRAYILRPPWTGITVVLKEEATRIREARERHDREAKQRMKKVWTPLPDRKITSQSQYYSW
jgi:ribosomal protein L22